MGISLKNFLEAFINSEKYGDMDTITLNVSPSLYYLQMAVCSATNIIANAISKSEIMVYIDNKPVQNEDYYLLNVSPNINQTSSEFWHKVMEKLLADPNGKKGVLIIEENKHLYCVDTFGLKEERPFRGNVYCNAVVGNLSLKKNYYADQVYLLKLTDKRIIDILNNLYTEYGKLIETAANAFKRTNGRKYKLHITGYKPSDEKFLKVFKDTVTQQLNDYLKSDTAVYPEFDGYDLKPEESQTSKSADDFIKLRKDIFEMTAAAYNVPLALMTGNITNIKDIVNELLTFSVDPYADLISEALNKKAGYKNFSAGNYYEVRTSSIIHRDMFELADPIYKLVGSGFVKDIDELRLEAGLKPCNEFWSKQHYMSKNFEQVKAMKEGENNE